MPSFHTKEDVRQDILATKNLGHRRVPISLLGQKAGVGVSISWIVDEAKKLEAAGETKMRFVIMIRKGNIGKRTVLQSGMKFGLVLSPADYGLFIESTNRSATTEKNILVRHTAVAGTEAVIGYTEDIPVELVP
jgi:hypothetical protein